MTPADALATVILPPLTDVGSPFNHTEAELMLLAIGLQESGFKTRRQWFGPARGFWQFEPGPYGGVQRFLDSGSQRLKDEVVHLGWPLHHDELYRGLSVPEGDHMAALLARGLLWSEPLPLPAFGNEEAAWTQYVRVWKPGKPSRKRWSWAYSTALATWTP